jgi:demethylmenaquinone methyltransferase/2-methoxy-6-polyprenyl-1,4-benzoquinol methylase
MVDDARRRATRAGFSMSSDRGVGELLAVLSAAAPQGARILELGTGVGVGLAWIVQGLGTRGDASVLSVDTDEKLLAVTRAAGWPAWVEFLHADGAQIAEERGPFDLIFADAAGGKLEGLDATIGSLAPRGVLVVDDMDPALHANDGLLDPLQAVRETLMSHTGLVAAELPFSTHIILAVKA